VSLSEISERFRGLVQLVLPSMIGGAQDFADFAGKFLQELRAGNPYLAEHVEQHLTTSGEGNDSESEFEFRLGLILDGLKSARGDA
jgi:hypothetical protein